MRYNKKLYYYLISIYIGNTDIEAVVSHVKKTLQSDTIKSEPIIIQNVCIRLI